MWVECWRPYTKAKARAEDILMLMLILKRMLNVKKMSSPEGKISWCLWWCWMWRRCRGNARADDNVTSSQAYLHLRPSPLAPFFNASYGWVCRKDVTFFGIIWRISSIVGPKNHALTPQIFILLYFFDIKPQERRKPWLRNQKNRFSLLSGCQNYDSTRNMRLWHYYDVVVVVDYDVRFLKIKTH